MGVGAPVEWSEQAAAVADAAVEPVSLPTDVIAEIYGHAREAYPEECCGLVLGVPGAGSLRVVRCSNVQNQRLHRGESNLDATRAFWIDEHELTQALREAEARGEQLRVVYHSHVDTAAYLSHTDVGAAVGPDGRPTWPDTDQLVVSVWEDGVRGAALFGWDEAIAGYRGRTVRETR